MTTLLPTTAADRKATPIFSGVLNYFPLAIAEIARVSKAGNDQHNPGQNLHWDRSKSLDHADCVARHLLEHGTLDGGDGQRHSAKLAWRALALLQTELELEAEANAQCDARELPEMPAFPAIRPEMAAAFETTDIGALRYGRAT